MDFIRSGIFDGDAVAHGFFTRAGGISEGLYASLNCGFGSDDDKAHIAENRARVAAALGAAPEHLLSPYQIHSADAAIIDAPWRPDARPRADGLATKTPGLALGILTADCLPVLLHDPEAGVIGAAHAGWRGALGGVLEATVAAMAELGAAPYRIVAALGPCIQQPQFEVGVELLEQFCTRHAHAETYFAAGQSDDKRQLDLPGYATFRLASAGVGAVERQTGCTYEQKDRFFSYRRATHLGEPDCGRLISAIMLNE